jgi:hypothetical protein
MGTKPADRLSRWRSLKLVCLYTNDMEQQSKRFQFFFLQLRLRYHTHHPFRQSLIIYEMIQIEMTFDWDVVVS